MQKPARLATLTTWQPERRIDRILTTRQIPFSGDPAALIAHAAQLLPQGRPRRLMLLLGGRGTEKERLPSLEIRFGIDDSGGRTSVSIALEASDVAPMVVHLARFGGPLAGVIGCDYHDDDDGEELSVGQLSAAALARLQTSSRVQ